MNRLVLFSKPPVLGRVKTRMVPPLDPLQALEVHRAFLLDRVGFLRSCRGRYAVELRMDGPCDIEDVPVRRQGHGDLGRRLLRAFRSSSARGADATAVIGADAPTLPTGLVDRAFASLAAGRDVAVVPARDGGYVLIASRRPVAALFREVPWGTPEVLATTLTRAAEAGVTVEELPSWYDVDDVQGLRQLRADLADPRAAALAPATASLLRSLDLALATVL